MIYIIGLGSMGKRRTRCFLSLGFNTHQIIGFDSNEKRRKEYEDSFGIKTTSFFDEELQSIEYLIISVPPDQHSFYIEKAIHKNIHAFIEASVLNTNFNEFLKVSPEKIIFPSCTLLFHPAIIKLREILPNIGEVVGIIYHSGQYLPEWHTYEKVSDFYVSKKETGGAREIVPFELTWLINFFGYPEKTVSIVQKNMEIEGAEEIDDTYSILLKYSSFYINLIVDVTSRTATRKLTVNGSQSQLYWDWKENFFRIMKDGEKDIFISFSRSESESGYNPNIGEKMYIDEINHFLKCCAGIEIQVNTLEKDNEILELLYSIEKNSI